MKKYLIIAMLFFHLSSYCQVVMLKHSDNVFSQSRMYLDPSYVKYDPAKAAKGFQQGADLGDVRAMNGLALLYGEGVGVDKDMKKSVYWFEKAAKGGYFNAWFNLGLIYKHGLGGFSQDFDKAFIFFQRASDANVTEAYYYKGYMLFKGLGCKQSYPLAVDQFKKVVSRGSSASMYMLGICFRNGYGIAKNLDSARYWLQKSANKGYEFAKNELANPTAEYSANTSDLSAEKSLGDFKKEKISLVVGKTDFPKDDLSGNYSGQIIRYDWSGQNVIGKSNMNLELKRSGDHYYGFWKEGDATVSISGLLTDSTIVFDNTSYAITDHYSSKEKTTFIFKNCVLALVKGSNTVSLLGRLQLWSPERAEPEKPIYVSLDKTVNNETEVFLKNIIAYPNPFKQSLNVDFTLLNNSTVEIGLYDVNNGRKVYSLDKELLEAGKYTRNLNVNLPLGYYVVKITYGSKVHSITVFRN